MNKDPLLDSMIDTAFSEHDYYTTAELAAELGILPTTVCLWIRRGKIRPEACVRRGRPWYFRRDVIDPMINAGELDPEPSDYPEPHQKDLKKHENLELTEEHLARYLAIRPDHIRIAQDGNSPPIHPFNRKRNP